MISAIPLASHSTPSLGHGTHWVDPATGVNLPSAHFTHVVAPWVWLMSPRGHCEHSPEPVSATYPSGQFSQAFVAFSCLPAAQGLHSVRAGFVMYPSPQSSQ